MNLVLVALAPVAIILFYVWFRDKYDREPWKLLLKALVAGMVITVPVIFAEQAIQWAGPPPGSLQHAAWTAFLVAGLTEEAFKFGALYLIFWKEKHFNEKFDGIVYAVFISLGFAAVENILYVTNGGIHVGWVRAITAVPAHALFGISMGYFFGIAHMYWEIRKKHLVLAFLVPVLLHGIYDFLLMADIPVLLLVFIPYLVYLYFQGFRKMHITSRSSVFRKVQDEGEFKRF